MPDEKNHSSVSPEADEPKLPDVGETLPPLDFMTYVLPLATSVMVNLGEIPTPEGQRELDLPLARQWIDLVGLLREKTKGNLTGEEERLLEQVYLDLRMKFVQVAGRQSPKKK